MRKTFRIDPEFENKIPPLTEAEFEQLRDNILESGRVYEPLTIWDGILVDGHHRWKIIQEHPGLFWETRDKDFPDKWAAFDWMYKNQLGRRNLTDEQRTYMIGKMYEARKKTVGGQAGNNNAAKRSAQNGQIVSTADKDGHGASGEIAMELNIGRNTVRRAEKFAKGVDALRRTAPHVAEKVLEGKAKATKEDVMAIAKMPQEEVLKAAEDIHNDRPLSKAAERRNGQQGNTRDSRNNNGYNREMRELDKHIKDAVDELLDSESESTYDLNDLIEEITVNGKKYVDGLRFTLSVRASLAQDAEGKAAVFKAIAAIMQDISQARGEFIK